MCSLVSAVDIIPLYQFIVYPQRAAITPEPIVRGFD